MPWDLVYRAMVDEYSFWRREVEDPAIIIITKANAGGRVVEGDAPIARSAIDFIAPMDHIAGTSSGSHSFDAGSRKKAKVARQSSNTSSHPSRDNSGNYTANRSNVELCPDWNAGSCVYSEKDCPKKMKHQCSRCLHNSHGAHKHDEKVGKGGGKSGKQKGRGKSK